MPRLYIVTRACCTSANCDTCHTRPRAERPVRVRHSAHTTQKDATKMALAWLPYRPVVTPTTEEA